MSTEAATFTSSSPAPQIEVTNSDEMTPGERAYFESRGNDTSGIVKSDVPPQQSAPTAAQQPAANDDDVDEDGEVVLDDKGNGRDPKTGKFVPKSAFLRVKGEAKEAKAQSQQLRDNLIAARERLAILTEAAAPAADIQKAVKDLADEPDIDPEIDIFASNKQLQARLAKFEKLLQDSGRQTAEMQQRAAFQNDVQRYVSKVPDWQDAFNHLVGQRHAILEALGVADKGQREAQLREEAQDVVRQALAAGRSPAEAFYQLAKASGYQARAAQQQGNPLAAAQEELNRLEANKAAGASLRGAGSGGVGETLTLSALASMDEDSYMRARDTHVAKYGKAAWDKLLRGG